MGIAVLLLHAENRILGRLGDAELYDFFGLDLNRFTSRGITADAGFAIDQDEFAEAGNGERVFGVLVGQGNDGFKNFNGLFLGEAVLFSDCSGDLGFGQCFGHDFVYSIGVER